MSSSPSPPSPPPSGATSGKHLRDLGTMIPGPEMARAWQDKARQRAISPREAYELAVGTDRTRERMTEVGYRLYWMTGGAIGCHEVLARPGGYAVVGRHGSCDVVVKDERLVSLRHVLVRATALDDGFPLVSLLDLQTTIGFELSDGTTQRSVAATGPVAFRIGTHALVALPSTGPFPETLPAPIVEPAERPPHRVAPQRIRELARGLDDAPPSRVTVLPGSVDLSQRRPSVVVHSEGHAPAGDAYEVILESRGRRAGVRLSLADLEHGVLIGRSDKCVDEGMREVLGETISRVHVLLVREKGENHLYDVASLVGTYAHGQRVRHVPLSDAGMAVELARQGGVTLHWRAA